MAVPSSTQTLYLAVPFWSYPHKPPQVVIDESTTVQQFMKRVQDSIDVPPQHQRLLICDPISKQVSLQINNLPLTVKIFTYVSACSENNPIQFVWKDSKLGIAS